jgi:elongation factor Ts
MEMVITASEVNKLRTMTGAGMMDCKKALTEANGDFEAAIDILRKKGQKVSASRSDKEASEGAVFIKVNNDATVGTLISLNCETDFVAKTDDFQNLGKALLEAAESNKPATVSALLGLSLADGRSAQEHVTDLVGKIGEKVEVSNLYSVKGECVVPYIHSNLKLGVLVALKGGKGSEVIEAGKDVSMQIAAMKPLAVDKDGIDAKTIEREIEIGKEQARAEGKPEAMLEKIALGKLNKFYKDNTLLNQDFVKDGSKSIAQYLDSIKKGLTVTEFKRVSVAG